MNPESPPVFPPSDCGVSPQSVPGAPLVRHNVRDDGRSPSHSPAPLPPATSFVPHAFDDMVFGDPPETHAEPEYEGEFDCEDETRERELMLDDLATYNDDFSRSNDEGWFYSDED